MKLHGITMFVFVVSLLLLSACGVTGLNETNANATQDSGNSSTAGNNSVSSSASSSSSSKTVKLEFFEQKREAVDTFNTIIKKFEEQNPDITITVNNVPNSSDVLNSRMSSGDMPPLFTVWPDDANYVKYAKDGLLLDLSGDSALKNIQSNILDFAQVNNKPYALPISLNTTGIYYNKDIFQKQGIAVPTTFDELIQAAKKLKAAGITPFIFPDKDSWTGAQEFQYDLGLYTNDVFQPFRDANAGKAHLYDNPILKSVAERMLEMRSYGQSDNLGTTYNDATTEFASGKSAMFMQGIWDMAPIEKANPNLKFSMFANPAVKASDTKVITGVDCAIAVSKSSKYVPQIRKFIQFMAQTSTAQMYSDMDHSPSAIKGVVDKTEQSKALTDYINQGKNFFWASSSGDWTPDESTNFDKVVQNLLVTKDVNGFLHQLDQLFYGKGQ